MVKALDCRSDEDVCAGSIPITGSFFVNDDGGRMQSTKLEEAKRPRMQARSPRERSD